jgi:hypothetical protein
MVITEIIDLEDVPRLIESLLRKDRKDTRRQGRLEGMRELLLHTIERRFGPLAEEKRHRVEAITSPARLKRLADKVLTAGSLEEMRL